MRKSQPEEEKKAPAKESGKKRDRKKAAPQRDQLNPLERTAPSREMDAVESSTRRTLRKNEIH